MDFETRSAMFRALGDPTRLRIFEFLRSCCDTVAVEENGNARPVSGPTVGEVCCHLTGGEKVTSTLSFHLKELRLAGLITMERRGRNMICAVCPEAVEALAESLQVKPSECCPEECCTEEVPPVECCEEECCTEEESSSLIQIGAGR